jgi:hypothetical protein
VFPEDWHVCTMYPWNDTPTSMVESGCDNEEEQFEEEDEVGGEEVEEEEEDDEQLEEEIPPYETGEVEDGVEEIEGINDAVQIDLGEDF